MRLALDQAELAQAQGEVPVGAVLVQQDEVIGAGFNCPISSHDPTAHAEVVALRQACSATQNYRLPGAVLYVTLEPCLMCAGALVHARIARLVYGTHEPKAGVAHTHPLFDSAWLNHRVNIEGGVLADECAAILSNFFAQRRASVRQQFENSRSS